LEGWKSTKELGEVLVGLQMVYPSIAQSCWNPLWRYLQQTWHPQTGCYIGPCLREWQQGEAPQNSLYDLYLAYFSKHFPKRLAKLGIVHLKGILIQPTDDEFLIPAQPFTTKGKIKAQNWLITSDVSKAYTVLEKHQQVDPSVEKTYTPFRLVWEDLKNSYSWVCQGGLYDKVDYKIEENRIILLFEVNRELTGDDRDKRREIEFFIDFHPDVGIKYQNQTVNTFKVDQEIHVSLPGLKAAIVFRVMEGKGDFLGHLMRSNRPSQIEIKGENRFKSYDWTLFLRSIRREGPCRMQVEITFLE
jgi:hypothetical protein